MTYAEPEYLMLTELQHYAFCPRQWALIFLEQEWQENVLTIDGHAMHEKVHDETIKEKRGAKILVRGMPVASRRLGLSGVCDMVEFIADKAGVYLPKYGAKYKAVPVEYKRGKPKEGEEDIVQLVAQGICLEEMLQVDIPYGFLYYGEPRRRTKVEFTAELRAKIEEMAKEMRGYIAKGYTPRIRKRKGCKNCSIKNICCPSAGKKSVKDYLAGRLVD